MIGVSGFVLAGECAHRGFRTVEKKHRQHNVDFFFAAIIAVDYGQGDRVRLNDNRVKIARTPLSVIPLLPFESREAAGTTGKDQNAPRNFHVSNPCVPIFP